MRFPPWFSRHAWLIVPLLALAFHGWNHARRVQRLEDLASVPTWSVDPVQPAADSPSGYAAGRRRLIIPEHENDSYQWIVQTQQMLASRQWRLRHVDYDNAPFGREVDLPSVYRWWLGFVAWCDHLLTGRSLALAVEYGARWADPLLQLLLGVSVTVFAARHFGRFAAALAALGSVALFPLGGSFLAGAPDRQSLALLCAVWSVLPLVAGLRALHAGSDPGLAAFRARRWFALAGVAGGLGLWVNVHHQWPVILGTAVGAVLATLLVRKNPPGASRPVPWRLWSLCGCSSSLLFYLIEYFPGQITMRLDALHPVFALSWWGLGELLERLGARLEHRRPWQMRALPGWLFALFLMSCAPVALTCSESASWLADDALADRLTALKGGVSATSLAAWLKRDGFDGPVAATLLPFLLLTVIALRRIFRRGEALATRAATAMACGALLVVMPIAWIQLRAWNGVDALLLILAAIVAAPSLATPTPAHGGRRWAAGAALLGTLGLVQLWPASTTGARAAVDPIEVQGLIERDLAQWLALRTETSRAVVLSPPDLTTSLYFHGGLRGLGTLHSENRDGVSAAVRIVSATSREEALELCRRRGVTHIVVPSWDTFLDTYASIGTRMPEKSFIAALHDWRLPNWLRPLPYTIPKIDGMDTQSVAVFQIVDAQDDATATIGLAEYFVETDQLDLAATLLPKLRRYPAALAATVARAEVELARGDTTAFSATLDALLPVLTAGADRTLSWRHRVCLAIVLAQGKQPELARAQVRRCLDRITDAQVRTLTTGTLFRLLILCKAYRMEIADADVRALALRLLPPEMRGRVR